MSNQMNKEELINYILSSYISRIIPDTEAHTINKRNIHITRAKTKDKIATINTENQKITECHNDVVRKILEDEMSNICTYFNNIDYNILLFLSKEYDFIGYRDGNAYHLYKDKISFTIDTEKETITFDPISLTAQNSLSSVARSINNLIYTYKNYKNNV